MPLILNSFYSSTFHFTCSFTFIFHLLYISYYTTYSLRVSALNMVSNDSSGPLLVWPSPKVFEFTIQTESFISSLLNHLFSSPPCKHQPMSVPDLDKLPESSFLGCITIHNHYTVLGCCCCQITLDLHLSTIDVSNFYKLSHGTPLSSSSCLNKSLRRQKSHPHNISAGL